MNGPSQNPNNPNPNNNPSPNDPTPSPDPSWNLIKHGGVFAISLGLFLAFFGKDSFIPFILAGGGLVLTALVFWSGSKLFMTLVEAVGTDTQNGRDLMTWYYNRYKPSPSRKANPSHEDLMEFMRMKVEEEEAAKEKARQHASHG